MRRILTVVLAGSLAIPLMAPQASSAASSVATRARRSVLDQVIPDVKFTNVALKDAIEFLRDVTGVNFHVNWKAIEAAGVSQDTNVNMRLRDVPFRKALGLLLNEAGAGTALTYFFDQNVLEVTTRELADKEMFTRVYSVEDLVLDVPDFTEAPDLSLVASSTGGSKGGGGGSSGGGGGSGGGGIFGNSNSNTSNQDKHKSKIERGEDLVTLVRETVFPDVWRENGGNASVRYFNGQLIVTASRSVHEAIGGAAD